MYQTCMFCNKPLGENPVVEAFPVGRRLVFDSERGRLWVVCRKCERWNLSPIEERWEAIDTCERLFSQIRLKASTEQVGMARHREGLELVRIGRPQRPEFASPYSPSSRRFSNPLHLDIEAIDDFAECDPARAEIAEHGFQQRLADLRNAGFVDYRGVAELKSRVLDRLFEHFRVTHLEPGSGRGA